MLLFMNLNLIITIKILYLLCQFSDIFCCVTESGLTVFPAETVHMRIIQYKCPARKLGWELLICWVSSFGKKVKGFLSWIRTSREIYIWQCIISPCALLIRWFKLSHKSINYISRLWSLCFKYYSHMNFPLLSNTPEFPSPTPS